jgi:hypothetical protein
MDKKTLEEDCEILPPFVFAIPKFALDSKESVDTKLFLDARDGANFDGRFVKACCDPERVNAEFKFVVVINESEIGDRVRYDSPSTQEPEDSELPINLSQRFKLCLFTTKPIKKMDEILVANPSNGTFMFSCSCLEAKCKISESLKLIEDFRNQGYEGTLRLIGR